MVVLSRGVHSVWMTWSFINTEGPQLPSDASCRSLYVLLGLLGGVLGGWMRQTFGTHKLVHANREDSVCGTQANCGFETPSKFWTMRSSLHLPKAQDRVVTVTSYKPSQVQTCPEHCPSLHPLHPPPFHHLGTSKLTTLPALSCSIVHRSLV